jgi:hypothetical protein
VKWERVCYGIIDLNLHKGERELQRRAICPMSPAPPALDVNHHWIRMFLSPEISAVWFTLVFECLEHLEGSQEMFVE